MSLFFIPRQENLDYEEHKNIHRCDEDRTDKAYVFKYTPQVIRGPRIADTSTHLTSTTLTLGTGIDSNNSVSIDDMPYSVDLIERDASSIAACFITSS